MNQRPVHSPFLIGARRLQKESASALRHGSFPSNILGFGKLLTVASGSGISAQWNWRFAINDGVGGFIDGLLAGNLGACSILPGTTAAASDYGIIYQISKINGSNSGTSVGILFAPLGASSGSVAFKVLLQQNGSDAFGPLYDLFALSDTGLATPLNLAGPLAPQDGRARTLTGATIFPAPDGSVGDAWYDLTGAIQLDMAPETWCVSPSSFGVSP